MTLHSMPSICTGTRTCSLLGVLTARVRRRLSSVQWQLEDGLGLEHCPTLPRDQDDGALPDLAAQLGQRAASAQQQLAAQRAISSQVPLPALPHSRSMLPGTAWLHECAELRCARCKQVCTLGCLVSAAMSGCHEQA